MKNVRIIVNNDADAATLTATPALAASLPVTYLQNPARAKVARTTSLASQQIKGTWPVARMISACALVRHNLSGEATWRLELFSDTAWTSLVWDSGTVIAWPSKALGDLEWGVDPLGATVFTGWGLPFSVLWFAMVAVGSFRITLTDPNNGEGYMEAGRLFMGRTLEPAWNFDYGIELSWQEDTVQERTDGGTLRSDPGEPYRRLKFNLNNLGDGERAHWLDIGRSIGKRKDCFICCYPENGGLLERDYTLAAKLVQMPASIHVGFSRHSQTMEFEEA